MPYKHAHYYIGAVLLTILVGFWASYFKVTNGKMPLAFHVHAVTSMTWLALLMAQHMTIHRRANALHRQIGLASFGLFPLLIVGFAMIINVSAARYAAKESPFIMHNGPAFGIGMLVAIAAYCTLFYQALKNRRSVKLHAGYMLATPLILFESPFSRIIDRHIPWLNFIGSEGVHAVQDTILISDAIAIIFAMVLYFMDRKNGTPWLVASFFMGLQGLLMWFAPTIPIFGALFEAYAALPPAVGVVSGFLAGAAAGWLGWRAGSARSRLAVAPA